jgi:transposase
MQQDQIEVTGGVDTHCRVHVGAVVNAVGQILATASFPVTISGYRQLLTWMRSFGLLRCVGVEGTGSYGAGLARFLAENNVTVVEVNRANRQLRRRRGKSDSTDAESAARAALNGEATAIPKSGTGNVEALRCLRIARRSAVKAATQAANQIRDLIVTAPSELRDQLVSLKTAARVEKCARMRPGALTEPGEATKRSLRSLARRYQNLKTEIAELDEAINTLCVAENPALLGVRGVGSEVASALLVAAGDNPDRMRTEASFAALCGSSPVEASSGKTTRHRLNQGGNREANNALWRIVMVRLTHDQTTAAYRDRRRAEGKSDREITRCLKRYVAREIHRILTKPPIVPTGHELRDKRTTAKISLETAARHLKTQPTKLSKLERGITHNNELANRYQTWLTTQHAA